MGKFLKREKYLHKGTYIWLKIIRVHTRVKTHTQRRWNEHEPRTMDKTKLINLVPEQRQREQKGWWWCSHRARASMHHHHHTILHSTVRPYVHLGNGRRALVVTWIANFEKGIFCLLSSSHTHTINSIFFLFFFESSTAFDVTMIIDELFSGH